MDLSIVKGCTDGKADEIDQRGFIIGKGKGAL